MIYSVYLSIYKAQHPDWSEEQIEQEAAAIATQGLEKENIKTYIENKVKTKVDFYENAYFVSKVNTGESWTSVTWNVNPQTGTSTPNEPASVSGETTWADWTAVKSEIEEKIKNENKGVVADNAPIKAFSEIRDWASIEALSSLEQSLAQAKDVLARVKISVDGSDVSPSDQWMTQDAFDTLSKSVEQAEKYLADAGKDYATTLLNTTPTEDEVENSLASLTWETIASGTGSNQVLVDLDTDANGDSGTASQIVSLAKTGDETPLALCVACMLVSAVVLGTVFVSRKRKLSK